MKILRRLLLAFLVPLAVAVAVFRWSPRGPAPAARPQSGLAGAAGAADPSGATPAERRAISEALATLAREKGAPSLRVATDDDAVSSPDRDDLVDLYATYHPYFVRGDLNGDGRLDFAQAFVETTPGGWFHVAVFFGRPDGSYEKPVWVEHSVSLEAGDISIERTLLTVVPDLSLDEARRWRWEAGEARFVDADAAAPPRADPDEVPAEDKPRARI